jgi:hypothetical protein
LFFASKRFTRCSLFRFAVVKEQLCLLLFRSRRLALEDASLHVRETHPYVNKDALCAH